jgi:2-methylcitrate dehydratase PrpD
MTVHAAARQLGAFAASLTLDAIPERARTAARTCLIDTVGVSLLGARMPWSAIVASYAQHYGSAGSSRILGTRAPVSAPLAALANGVYAHAFELDSLRKPGAGVHPGAALVPVALAIGEEVHASGEAVIAAIVAACEVMFRIGAATHHSTEGRGFHAPGLTGPFGAALCAAHLLGLDAGQMTNALGIAGSLCSGLMAFAHAERGAMVKRLHLGRAAESGILAARLAQRGFEGPEAVLEGQSGFLEAYCAHSDAALLTRGLGQEFEILKLCIKRYPCHVTAHAPVQTIQAMRARERFGADDVTGITLRASGKVLSHHAQRDPADVMSAQYSVPFCTAIALTDDPLDPLAFAERALDNPKTRELARRVELAPLPQGSGLSAWGCELEVKLADGRVLSERADDFKGTPASPLSDDELREKFMRCAGGAGFASKLHDELLHITDCDDVARLTLA